MYRCARNSKAVLSSSESPPMLPLPEATRGKSHQVPSGSSGGPWRPSTGRRPGMDRAVSPLPADCFHLVFVSPEATAVSEELGSDASPAPSVRIHGARHARKVCHCRPPPCAHQEEERVMRHVVTFILTQPGKSQLSLGVANVNLHNWWTQKAGSSLITAASHYETEVLRTRCGSGFTLISRPLWAESGRIWYFTSHPAVKLSTLRIPGRLSVWLSQNHMLSWVDFLNFLPAVKSSTVYMQICCEDDDGDTAVNGWTSMKPARTHRAAKSVTSSLCVASGRGPTLKYVKRFTESSRGEKEKEALFNVELFSVQHGATWKHRSDSDLIKVHIQSSQQQQKKKKLSQHRSSIFCTLLHILPPVTHEQTWLWTSAKGKSLALLVKLSCI